MVDEDEDKSIRDMLESCASSTILELSKLSDFENKNHFRTRHQGIHDYFQHMGTLGDRSPSSLSSFLGMNVIYKTQFPTLAVTLDKDAASLEKDMEFLQLNFSDLHIKLDKKQYE